MTKATMEKLTQIVQKHFAIQQSQDQGLTEKHTTEELINFAIDEAWENGELDFLKELQSINDVISEETGAYISINGNEQLDGMAVEMIYEQVINKLIEEPKMIRVLIKDRLSDYK